MSVERRVIIAEVRKSDPTGVYCRFETIFSDPATVISYNEYLMRYFRTKGIEVPGCEEDWELLGLTTPLWNEFYFYNMVYERLEWRSEFRFSCDDLTQLDNVF